MQDYILINNLEIKVIITKNLCEKCLNLMRIEKTEKDYVLVCDFCENKNEEKW